MSPSLPRTVPRNIVICSDGTGNTGGKGRGTNVFKLYEAVDLHGRCRDDGEEPVPQIAFYDDGVGTEALKPLKVLGGAFGLGLTRNVKQLYTQLVRSYTPGDRIYLFGFSRGAFTVRTLAGLILTCGIIDRRKVESARALERRVDEAYREYRLRYRQIFKPADLAAVGQHLRVRDDVIDDVKIEFIGVWDTVDAVGLPFDHAAELLNRVYRYRFPDRKLSHRVKRACHALAIDDERHTFHPVLWDERDEEDGRILQVWFAGVHSNVGGGYPKQGMSLVALDWMMTEAEAAGLRFLPSRRDEPRYAQNVHDKLYDSRAGAAVYYRYRPRDVGGLCEVHGTPVRIHASVFDRIVHATQGYAPGNLPRDYQVVLTGAEGGDRVERMSTVVGDALDAIPDTESRSPLERVRREVGLREWAHYAFLAASIAILLVAAGAEHLAPLDVAGLRASAVGLWRDPVATVLGLSPAWVLSFAGLGVAAWFGGWRLERRMREEFSRIWTRAAAALR